MDFEQNNKPETVMDNAIPQPILKESVKKKIWPVIGIVLLIAASFGAGWKTGNKGYTFEPKTFKVINQSEMPQTVDYQLLWDAIDTVSSKYIDQPIDQQKVLYGAVSGAIAAIGDPYTEFFEPKDLQSFRTDLQGSFDGIGAEISKKNGQIVVVAPLEGTPAQRAGLMAQDAILEVDGQSTANWTTDEAVDHIRGKRGTQVILTIFREGKTEPFKVTITRDKIEVKSVKVVYKEVNGKNIAVMTISKFGDDTEPLFNSYVNEILNRKVDGLVLDLRNNPGGYLQTAVDLASNWVQEGQVVVTEARSDGDIQKYKANGNTRLSGIKTVILINGGSASAAEILSGALHDHGIAELIGEKSFGKGSVQELVELRDGAAVKVTVAKWITPNGKNLNKDGLNPDVEVKLTEDDFNNNRDPQMDKALEEIMK